MIIKPIHHKMHKILDPVFSIAMRHRYIRLFSTYVGFQARLQNDRSLCRRISKDNVVLSGPFKGMKYPNLQAMGSALFPKILGNYEDELSPVINEVLQRKYDVIFDIGAAEGYYAVGLAMKMPEAKVYAFDTNPLANELCLQMTKVNNVKNVSIEGFCDEEVLSTFNLGKRSLIFSDCEGYEIELFTEKSIRNLGNSDVIIELHDNANDAISKTILPLFQDTHNLTLIKSVFRKKVSDYRLLDNLKGVTDFDLIERNCIMSWAFLEPKAIMN